MVSPWPLYILIYFESRVFEPIVIYFDQHLKRSEIFIFNIKTKPFVLDQLLKGGVPLIVDVKNAT